MQAIHQYLPTAEYGAVYAHTLGIRDVLRTNGFESEIFAEFIRPEVEAEVLPFSHHIIEDEIAIYQMAIGSQVADRLRSSDATLVVNYHNLTPLEYLEPWDPGVAYGVGWGRQQLRELALRSALGVAVSHYNEKELIEAGFQKTKTVPILFDTSTFEKKVNESLERELHQRREDGESIWLFVGRIAPNKCQHDVIKAFAYYRKIHNPNAHLYIVGGSSSDNYKQALEQFIDSLELSEAVTLTGAVPDADLAAYYRGSGVFVCLSEHEGFCVPLLEALHNRLPIVAFRAAAVPETLGNTGILLKDKSAPMVAGVVNELFQRPELREQLVQQGLVRLQDFSLERSRSAFLDAIKELL